MKNKSLIQKTIENHKSLIKRVILCGATTASMIAVMGALTHGSLADLCSAEIKKADNNLISIQEKFQEERMSKIEKLEQLRLDYLNDNISLEEYRNEAKKVNEEYDDSEFQSSVRYNMKIKEKNEQRKQKHEHCCFINTGMFAITSSTSVILLKKRLDEFDKEYKSVSSNKEEFVSKN